MTTFWLKIIAITTMAIDHIGAVLFPEYGILRIIGRLAFPIFAFLVAEGGFYTKDINKYILRMFGFAIISEIPFDLAFFQKAFYWGHQNVMWTFTLALLVIWINRKFENPENRSIFTIMVAVVVVFIAELMKTDYSGIGVLMVLSFYFFREKPGLKFFIGASLMFQNGIVASLNMIQLWKSEYLKINQEFNTGQNIDKWFMIQHYIQALACLSFPLIGMYNHQKGYNIKYFFYGFYPVHLLILYFLYLVG